jgi:transposase
MEALRCLKRRLSDAVYRQLLTDAAAAILDAENNAEAGPGGHSGASSQSSAADLSTPVIGSSDQPQPGPAETTLPAQRPAMNPRTASAASPRRRRAGAVKVERPTGRTTLTATRVGAPSKATRLGP